MNEEQHFRVLCDSENTTLNRLQPLCGN